MRTNCPSFSPLLKNPLLEKVEQKFGFFHPEGITETSQKKAINYFYWKIIYL
jgi:hypothetical protein